MRLASSPLRLAGSSTLTSALTLSRSFLLLHRSVGTRAAAPDHSVTVACARRSSTAASVSFGHVGVGKGDAASTDASEDEPRAAAATDLASTSPVAHLKRRGHFLPAPLSQDSPWEVSSRRGGNVQRHGQFLLSAHHYGKWRDLLFDYDRLLFESGLVSGSSSAAGGTQRAVDLPEHAGDMALWSALFNFAQRQGDREGALVVWREVFQRRQLCATEGRVARSFWMSMADAAVDDEAFLESTWAYAEWMHGEHGAVWPNYYRTVVTSLLESGDYDGALRWHLRLSAHFGVAKRDFFDLLQAFLADPDPALQETLRSIYATSRHRLLYDTIVPLLWSRGCSALARMWRETLVRHGDWPTTQASRPFLQHLAGYYPEIELCPQEHAMASAQRAVAPVRAPEKTQKTHDLPSNLYYLLNRVHGETFGIPEKSFNDTIGSKWFATSWVSLDTAINLVYGLGIGEIGPLSLQSIALREGSAAGVARRIQQLAEHHIGIGSSSYAKAIRQMAQAGDDETLRALLHSTLHPDVFDDVVLQRQAIGSATFTGDWKTHWLLLAVRLAVAEDAAADAANRLLLACLDQRRKPAILRLLDEFAARGMALQPAASAAISHLILDEVPQQFRSHAMADVDFYAALCRRLAALRWPVATEAWQNILMLLGRQGRLADLEALTDDIVDRYAALQSVSLVVADGGGATFKVHVSDVPSVVRGDDDSAEDDGSRAELGYRLLPRDLPLDHPLHPLSLLFSRSLVEAVVRWYFHRKMAYRQGGNGRAGQRMRRAATATAIDKQAPPAAFGLAGGIRLLAQLRDRGVGVPTAVVRTETLVCIAAVFGPPSLATRYWQPARAANQLTLGEVKLLCEAAWAGSGRAEELLPSLPALEKALAAVQPLAESFGKQFTRRGDNKRATGEAFVQAIEEGPAR